MCSLIFSKFPPSGISIDLGEHSHWPTSWRVSLEKWGWRTLQVRQKISKSNLQWQVTQCQKVFALQFAGSALTRWSVRLSLFFWKWRIWNRQQLWQDLIRLKSFQTSLKLRGLKFRLSRSILGLVLINLKNFFNLKCTKTKGPTAIACNFWDDHLSVQQICEDYSALSDVNGASSLFLLWSGPDSSVTSWFPKPLNWPQ